MDIFKLSADLKASQHGGGRDRRDSVAGPAASPSYPTQWVVVDDDASPSVGITEGKLTKEKMDRALIVGLHWLNASGPLQRLDEVKAILDYRWGTGELRQGSPMFYQRHYHWAGGAKLCFCEAGVRAADDCCVSINGDAIMSLEPLDQLRLLHQLRGLGFKVSRVDCKADDYGRRVPLELVHAAAERGEFCGFRITEERAPKRRRGGELVKDGDMRTFGRRGATNGGGAYYRIYDKALETEGEVDCIRWEVEFSGEKAQRAGELLTDCDTEEEFEKVIASLVGGNIDFRSGKSTHVERRQRLEWFEEFRQLLGAARVRIERAKVPLQAALAAVKRQYSSTLAKGKIICDRLGVDFLAHVRAMIDDACSILDPDKLDRRDEAINLSAAFSIRPRRAAVFVPPKMAVEFFESIPF